MGLFSRFFPHAIAKYHTQFNHDIEVIEKNSRRSLEVNGIEQSSEYVEKLFSTAFLKLAHWHPGPVKNILVFGVGGGIIFRQLRELYPHAHITGVDIDRKIIEIAKKYFALDTVDNCSFVVADAKEYISRTLKKVDLYDLVVIDIFVGNDVPFFVTQNKFLVQMGKCMLPGRRLMMNYFSYANQEKKSELVLKKLNAIYQSVDSYKILRNIIFYCQTKH